VALVLDASVALKWVLEEPDSHLAQALAAGEEEVLLPDFWLHEACNVCWLQVRKGVWSPDEAREALELLCAQVPPTPTGDLPGLHALALEIGLAVSHSTYDTLYVAFALAMGARAVIAADGRFVQDMRRHPHPALRALLIPLAEWGRAQPP
jgi:predicted nucleic acid-binding protein